MALTAAGCFAWHWYQKLPKPRKVAVTIDAIPVTRLEKVLHPAPLVVHFSESAGPLESLGKAPEKGVRIEPAVAGTWKWEDDRRLVFRPAQDWPAGTKYRVALDKSTVAPHVLLDSYALETTTPRFIASLAKLDFYQDPRDPAIKQVVATMDFTHSVDAAELEKHLTIATIGGTNVFKSPTGPHFALTFGMHHRVAYLRTTPLALPEREDFMLVKLGAGVKTAQGGAETRDAVERKVRVPDVYSFFKIESVEGKIVNNDEGEPQQMLIVKTTAAAKPEEIAKNFHVYLLPKKPKTEDAAEDDGQWQSANEVDDDILKTAKLIETKLIPSAEENAKEHVFKISLEKDGSLFVKIPKGVRALGDFLLGDDYSDVLPVPELPREVAIEGSGGVLALGGERKLSIRSRGVSTIEYEIGRVPADQINHLVSQTEGDFQNPIFRSGYFDEENIARIATEKQAIALKDKFKANFSAFDFSRHLRAENDGGSALQGLFFLKAREWQPPKKKSADEQTDDKEDDESSDREGPSDGRFILVTDIGMLVKENGDGSCDVFLASIKGRGPLGGVPVQILAKNGVPLVTGTTGADGRATFSSLGKPLRERAPVAFVARNGDDVSFIPFHREDRQLDFSRFDIDGIQRLSGAELDAFVFTERGIYRPADEIHAAIIVKQGDWKGRLAGLPIETEIVDARGLAVQTKKLTLPESGFVDFTYQTAYESPSGSYAINAFLVRDGKRDTLLGSTSVTVKEFLPDRMKITSRLSKETKRGWVTPEQMQAAITLQNLYGTPAADHRVSARMRLSPSGFEFEEYVGFTFFDKKRDEKREVKTEEIALGEIKTDELGAASFDLGLERFTTATYAMSFCVEGFEADGGRSVTTSNSALVSDQHYVIGSKADGDPDYVKMGSERSVDFIAVDPGLSKVGVEDLQCNIIEQAYVSILRKQENGDYAYDSVLREKVVKTEAIGIPEMGLKYALPTATPGKYVLELRDSAGARVSKLCFTVVGRGNVSRSLEKNAELQIKLSKPQYNAGEEIEISVTAPYTGSGLITIERDKVYAHAWFTADATSSIQRIRVPADFEGTGYINVAFIRALDSREVFTSPLSYGVVPFRANIERRRIPLSLSIPATVRPGAPLTIHCQSDRPAKAVIFAVDQGILQVTGFQTPDPLEYFFRKCALTVRTAQIVDLIIPEFSIWRAASAFGGDGDDKHLNPFKRVTEKPVVFWSGIIDVDKNGRDVIYDVPDYFDGALTVMAVGISPDAVASAEKNCLVCGPFVVTPSAPTVAAPGDQFDVGVTVANGVEGAGENAEITLQAAPSEHLEVMGTSSKKLRIAEGREATTAFTFRVKDKLGSGSVVFRAALGREQTSRRCTLSVRPPVPFATQIRSGNFTRPSVELPVERAMHPEFRKVEASISALPLGLARGLDAYLKNFPHGCSEQLTSGAFCRLLLADEADFALNRSDVNAQLEKTFATLARRQNDKGAFGYWAAGESDGIDFVSVYATHFLSEARAAGFPPPVEMFARGLRHLKSMVEKEPGNFCEARTVAYAIYVLTREGVITTNYVLNLRDTLEKKFEKKWEADLTGVYLAAAYAMLKNDNQAQKLIRAYSPGRSDGSERADFYQPLGADSQYFAILARHFPALLKKIPAAGFEAIVRPVSAGNFNTLSAAYAVWALKSYSQHIASSSLELGMSELSKGKKETRLQADGRELKRAVFSEATASLRFSARFSGQNLGAFYQIVEAGYDRAAPARPVAAGIEVYRELLGDNGKPTKTAYLGKPITVRLRVRSLTNTTVTNAAIVDLLPGGFEIANGTAPIAEAGMEHVEVREDRAVFFGSINSGVQTITYQIKPTNRGEFVVPPPFAESMYDRAIHGCGAAGKISVIDAK
ncbi:MAG: alpha-2-macroglobulin [Chthoniobacter sp.]|nr:alpha-2-macroglobulin [Chthoniobacter sp.]